MRPIALKILLLGGAIIALLALVFAVFPDAFINGYVKNRNIRAFERANPGCTLRIDHLHYDVWGNGLGADSIELTKPDSGYTVLIATASVAGVSWLDLFLGDALNQDHFANSNVVAEDAVITFPARGYELRCARLNAVVADSEIVVEAVELHPLLDDEQFFAANDTRKTRYRLTIPRIRVSGSNCQELLANKRLCGRVATIENLTLDALVNKDKPGAVKSASPPREPGRILARIRQTLQVDSVSIQNASVRYGERFAVGAKPGVVTFDSVQIAIGGIDDEGMSRETATVMGQAIFMKDGTLSMRMAIPTLESDFTFHYSGSLTRMDLTRLNSFVEIAERQRVKSGILENASFDINVRAGHATGRVDGVYSDLNLAILDPETGTDTKLTDRVTSFFVNTFKIRNDNPPDDMKRGRVDYTRKPDQRLPQFLWLAVRTGIADIVGF